MRIKQIMSANVISAQADTSARELLDLIERNGFHHIPIVDHEKHLIGIVSDRDVSKHVSPFEGTELEREEDRESLNINAEEIMSTNPITITEDSRIKTASILLLEHNFSCLPVMCEEDETMVGIITWKDILNYYVYSDYEMLT